MGTALPIDPGTPPPGNLCATCWGPGKPFGLGPTPSYVFAKFTGMVMCPGLDPRLMEPPNDITFRLDQVPIAPCFYEHPLGADDENSWWVRWNSAVGGLSLFGRTGFIGAGDYFVEMVAPCTLNFTNWLNCLAFAFASGGTGVVWW
ncbi:hypothetical protein ES703_26308 [subsurface metagenome]